MCSSLLLPTVAKFQRFFIFVMNRAPIEHILQYGKELSSLLMGGDNYYSRIIVVGIATSNTPFQC